MTATTAAAVLRVEKQLGRAISKAGSIRKLSAQLGIHHSYLALLLQGRRTPSMVMLGRISNGLSIMDSDLIAFFRSKQNAITANNDAVGGKKKAQRS